MDAEKEALDALKSFFDRMTQWEFKAGEVKHLFRDDPAHSPVRVELILMQQELCVPGAKARGYSFSSPPTYSNIEISSIECTKDKVLVKTSQKRAGVSEEFHFKLAKKNDKWLLVERSLIPRNGAPIKFSF